MLPGAQMMQAPAYSLFARIYDRLMGDFTAPRVWRNFCFLCRRYGIRFRSTADIGCGTGTFLRQLWYPGLVAYGIDGSPAMLRIARQKNSHTDIDFFRQDIRRLQLPMPVDLITCNQDTLNYLLDAGQVREVFKHCHNHLATGGHLVFDMIRGMHDDDHRPRQVSQEIRMPGIKTLWQSAWLPKRRASVVRMQYWIKTAAGQPMHATEIHRQRWYGRLETAALLNHTGFELLGIHNAETGQPAGQNHFWVNYIARKRSIFH